MEFSKKFPKYGLSKSIIIHEKKGYANSMVDELFYKRKMPNFERKRMLNLVEVYDFYVKEYIHIIVYRTIGCFRDGDIIQALVF